MSDEDFLKRWSRRKREAAEVAKPEPPKAEARDAESRAAPENGVAADKSADKPQAEFDPATLPPIESITAVSDITAFLRAGVPAELTRAALRRVWTADPSIRDFVGLAENAWDFTDPHAMPGFGPLESTEEVRTMIARLVDSIGKAAQPNAGETLEASAKGSENLNDASVISTADTREHAPSRVSISDQGGEIPVESLENQVLLHSNKEDVAAQRDDAEAAEKPKQLSRRGHGGALPQ
jgi:uncharacterized protein DUF3306